MWSVITVQAEVKKNKWEEREWNVPCGHSSSHSPACELASRVMFLVLGSFLPTQMLWNLRSIYLYSSCAKSLTIRQIRPSSFPIRFQNVRGEEERRKSPNTLSQRPNKKITKTIWEGNTRNLYKTSICDRQYSSWTFTKVNRT